MLPCDIRQAATGVPVIDMAVRTLYETGYLHNHARMWLASYVVHVRKVDWRIAADWLYGHLLDGDLASNHLSWQWVAGTGSKKPYLFNAANVARYAPTPWHSPGSVIDQSYEALDRLALEPVGQSTNTHHTLAQNALIEPPFYNKPHPDLGFSKPDPSAVAGRNVWLVHPWNLSDLPTFLPANTLVVGVFVDDFHRAWPWNERRWRFVAGRMAELAAVHWQGDAAEIGATLQSANRVRSLNDPHLSTWLPGLAACDAAVELFPTVPRRCDSFSQWWTRTLRGVTSVSDLLTARQAPARWMD
jgi:deoxyribodipyrimidine photo-lyase